MINDEYIKSLKDNPSEAGMLLRASFKDFISVFHFYIYRKEFTFKTFHIEIIKALENIVFEKPENLIINLPPRFGKSIIMQYYVCWTYTINRYCNNIYSSYSDELINKFSGEIRQIVDSELYKTLFQIGLSKDTNNKSLWKIANGGETRAVSLGGAITGFGAGTKQNKYGGAIILDDILKSQEAKSENAKQKCTEYYRDTLLSRKNTDETPIIIIMQRLAVDDLIGYIELNGEKYKVIKYAAMDENGQSIWEETISTAKLQELKNNAETKDMFYTQYQQEPVIAGGNKFKEEMFAIGDMPESFDWHYIVADTAYKDGEDNDDTVFGHYGVKDKKLYLNDILVAHIEAKDIESYCVPFITKHNEYGFRGAYIEDKGHGIYLNQKLPSQVPMPSEEEIKDFFKDRKLNKVERANNILPFMASQVLIINKNIPKKIIEKIIKQCLNFPKDKHDDIVDIVIDGIKLFYLKNKPSILDVI